MLITYCGAVAVFDNKCACMCMWWVPCLCTLKNSSFIFSLQLSVLHIGGFLPDGTKGSDIDEGEDSDEDYDFLKDTEFAGNDADMEDASSEEVPLSGEFGIFYGGFVIMSCYPHLRTFPTGTDTSRSGVLGNNSTRQGFSSEFLCETSLVFLEYAMGLGGNAFRLAFAD